MYSQCPNCKAIFSVSEADIAAHHGLVRCGYCAGVFNAPGNEVDGVRAKPGDGAAGAAGEAASPAADEAGTKRAGPDEEERAAGRSRRYPGPADRDADRSPGIREGHGRTVPGPGPDDRAPEHSDEALIEPVLPGARAVADRALAEPPDETARVQSEEEETEREATATEKVEPEAAEPERGQPADAEPEPAEPEPAEREIAEPGEPESAEPKVARWEGAPEAKPVSRQQPKTDESVPRPRAPEEVPREEPVFPEPAPDDTVAAETERENEAPQAPRRAEPPVAEEAGLPGEITEEITIEAPPVLWNAFDEHTEEKTEQRRSTGVADDTASDAGVPGAATGPGARAPGARGGRRAPLRSPYGDHDVAMVELPQPRPFKTATLSLLTVLLALLLVWQAKTFYLDDLAQVPSLRPYLESLCRPLGCVLPPRRDFASIDLIGTSIDVYPEYPGALQIKASLINRAHFPQPYPPLRVTLTDREGRVVGRRTYLPSEYRAGDDRRLPIREVRNVSINLAQPAENAVGYEVELMPPLTDNES